MPEVSAKPTFFPTLARWRAWLEKHHETKQELWVGFHKRGTGKPSITWPESVDGALAFGWIDGIRKSLDEESYVIRFTPRKRGSNWSAVNIARITELIAEGLVVAAGIRAFEERKEEKSRVYAYEQRHVIELDTELAARFRANAKAWSYFEAQAPWYRRTATYWVMSPKKPETKVKRFDELVRDSAAGRFIKQLARPAGSGAKTTTTKAAKKPSEK